jgi:hypothetical protein
MTRRSGRGRWWRVVTARSHGRLGAWFRSRGCRRAMAVVTGLSACLLSACGTATSSTSSPASSPSSSSTITATCPPASLVDTTLGSIGSTLAPDSRPSIVSCSYLGSALSRIDFQPDTAASFAARKKEFAATGHNPVDVTGLGDAAFAADGGIYLSVLKGSMSITVVAPGSTGPQVQNLARLLVG